MILLDTHVLVWAVDGDANLGTESRDLIRDAETSDGILIAAITPWEIAMLVEREKLAVSKDVGDWVEEALGLPGIELAPLSTDIAVESARLPGAINKDPADRMIVATARSRGATLLTADRDLLRYAEDGYVRAKDAGT